MTMVETTESSGGPSIWAVIPAAGSSERFSDKPGQRRDKLMTTVARIPIIVRSVEGILDTPGISGAVVVYKKEQEVLYKRALDQYGHGKPVKFVLGGENRQDSVKRGVEAVPDSTAIVVIHDAARPLISTSLTSTLIKTLQAHADWVGCIPGLPLTDTIKSITQTNEAAVVEETLDRNLLWAVQTPQVFKKSALLEAYSKIDVTTPYTDEAQLIELAGAGQIGLVKGQSFNIKITHPEDLATAETLYPQIKNKL